MEKFSVPMDLVSVMDHGYHAHVKVFIDNHPYTLVVDTGASHTAFDLTTIQNQLPNIILTENEEKSSGIGSNEMDSFIGKVPTFKLGDLELKNFEVALLDLSAINIAYERAELDKRILLR